MKVVGQTSARHYEHCQQTKNPPYYLFLFLFFLLSTSSLKAQFILPTGGNHPELHWHEFETEHFTIVFHDGLYNIALKAAPVAEEAYRVVTTNLKTPLGSKVKIYLSDYDEIKNAFAFEDDYIFIWMRGILDDLPYGFRSSGTSKWLRSVITHEFTHIVIAHATKDIFSFFSPGGYVPRWFNEGLARFHGAGRVDKRSRCIPSRCNRDRVISISA